MHNKIIIIDLDGTFVSVNTFHKWIKFLFIETLKKFQLIRVTRILTIITLRALKWIDHAKMKQMILEISEKSIQQKQIRQFVTTLNPYVNKNLLDIIQNSSNTTILATAAPLLYAQSIKGFYHFDYILATNNITQSPWQENIREIKAKNVQKLFEKHAWKIQESILYTDHHDDMPLMHLVSCTYLVNASEKTKILSSNANINVKIINEEM